MSLNSRITIKFLLQIGILFIMIWCIIGSTFAFYLYSKKSPATEGNSPSVVLKKLPEATMVDGTHIQVSNNVLKVIKQKNGWLQILNSAGETIYSFRTPKSVPAEYSPGLLVYAQSNPDKFGFNLFIKYDTTNKQLLTWIYGEPMNKTTTVAKEPQPFVYFFILFMGSLFATIMVAFFFGRRMGVPTLHMMNWIQALSNKSYSEPTNVQGLPKSKKNVDGELRGPYRMYQDVLMALENLAFSLQQSDLERKRLETTREEWIAGITHDLRTPLSSVKGYATLFTKSDYNWTDTEISEFGNVILDKAAYMETLINDLGLTFRLKNEDLPMNCKPSDVVEVVRRTVIDLVNAPQTEGKTVLFECEVDEIIYPLDEKWMTRALENLLTNSSLYNPNGTTISVSVQPIPEKKAQYSGVCITINDNGTGMDEETLARLFERYYRGTNTSEHQAKGSGLGTAIAKQLIEAHDGHISVESEIGRGTTILIQLPPKN
jgi:signal transduction histidine kinase